jgi:TPR repeat protein
MKTVKIALAVVSLGVFVVSFMVIKNYCLDKGLLALKEEQYDIAVKYLKPIAILGDSDAQGLIAECYVFGFAVPQDNEKAIYWFKRATKKDGCNGEECIAANLYYVGEKYLNGVGVKTDNNAAIYWIKKAAENGYPKAMNYLSDNNIK